jgi:hypothetical protein
MKLGTCWDILVAEPTGWRAQVYDVVKKLAQTPSADKDKVVPQINELRMVIEDLDERINQLRTVCPTAKGQISLSNRRALKIVFLLPMPSASCSSLKSSIAVFSGRILSSSSRRSGIPIGGYSVHARIYQEYPLFFKANMR